MNRNVILGIVIALLLVSIPSPLFGSEMAQTVSSTVLYIHPSSITDPTLTPGHNFTIDVMVADVEYLFGWQMNMSFNPDVLGCVNVTEGDFFEGTPDGSVSLKIIEESWVLFGVSMIGSHQGVSGSGVLATVEFYVKAVGESPIVFELGGFFPTFLIAQSNPTPPPNFYDIEFTAEDGYFSNIPVPISIFTNTYRYQEGDTMYLGLDINNPLTHPINVCIAVWLEKPVGPIRVILHAHAVTLPAGLSYSNPSFRTFMLPSTPPGVYTWHAALLNPSPHAILIEDTAEWQLS